MLFSGQKTPATLQPLHRVSASPVLSPADSHLPAVIYGSEANPDFTIFPSVSVAKTLDSFSHHQ